MSQEVFVVFLIVSSASFLYACVTPEKVPDKEDLFRLDLVHYNDFHDRFEETSVSYPICTTNDTSCLGGFPRLYYEIQKLLAEKPGSLLLNAGDNFQGTYWYTLLKSNITQQFMNLLPHDAFAIGNHEFDDGIEGLAPYLAGLKAPVVAANIDTSNVPALEGLYKPHIVIERNGKKIGIIGLITEETAISSSVGEVIFKDPLTTVRDEAKKLTEAGIDIVLVLSHCGLDVDKKIAEEYGENIDVIIGGHSHSLLWNGTSPSGERKEGPYPVVLNSKNKPGHQIVVVTASAFTKYLGNMTVWFDNAGDIQAFEGAPVFLNRTIPEDNKIKELLRPYAESLHSIVNEVVGRSEGNLLTDTCGYKECALGNIVADSLLEAAKLRHPSNLTQMAFILRNNLRGSISNGPITRGQIINALPFTNKLMTISIKGRYLKDALEHCLLKFWTEDPFNGPWMPQIAGFKMTYNYTEPAGSRVTSLYTKHGNKYKPLNFDEEYELVVYDFIAKGGNDFKMLRENTITSSMIGTDAEALESYVRNHTPLFSILEGRIIAFR